MVHGVVAVEDTKLLDIFNPCREDFLKQNRNKAEKIQIEGGDRMLSFGMRCHDICPKKPLEASRK